MRYLINDSELSEESALQLYQTMLTWFALHSDKFVFTIQSGVYDEQENEERLRKLGQITDIEVSEMQAQISSFSDKVLPLLNKLSELVEVSLNDKERKVLKVEGNPTNEFIYELTHQSTPNLVVSGSPAPVEDLEMLDNGRSIYRLYDYGRTQIIEITELEFQDLCKTLERAGLNPTSIQIAPTYLTDQV